MQGKIKGFLFILVILAVIAGAVYYFSPELFQGEKKEAEKSFGENIFDKIKGPAERIPETNPFKKVKLNPFE